MFALHWICALTLALVSCLCSQPVKRDADELLAYISNSKSAVEGAKCAEDTSLYSPFDIREDCMSSALNCTIDELSVLISECNITKDKKDYNLTQNLTDVLILLTGEDWNITTSSSPDCTCEMYKETDAKKFIDNMEIQVQQLRSLQ